MGSADLVILVNVHEVWSEGLRRGQARNYLKVGLERVLMGELPKRTADDQILELNGVEELPGGIQGKSMVLFVRWAPGEQPAFHHHLMIATDEMVSTIESMVRHARAEGHIGTKAEKRRARREKRRRERENDARSGGQGSKKPVGSPAAGPERSVDAKPADGPAADAKADAKGADAKGGDAKPAKPTTKGGDAKPADTEPANPNAKPGAVKDGRTGRHGGRRFGSRRRTSNGVIPPIEVEEISIRWKAPAPRARIGYARVRAAILDSSDRCKTPEFGEIRQTERDDFFLAGRLT